MRTSLDYITSLLPNQAFVFGSNSEGIHGGGAARIAHQKFGAIYGKARGLQGQSYAIVTKNLKKGMRSIELSEIEKEVDELLKFATDNPHLEFLVTRFGCELAGYEEREIGEMFKGKAIPNNVLLPQSFLQYL